jgi:geranylgeranyl reductase family protein
MGTESFRHPAETAGRETIRTGHPLVTVRDPKGRGWPGNVDVVVVGAGPAGSTAAARLAEAGIDVALIERAVMPRDKPCGGGLSPKAYRMLDTDVTDLVLARPRAVNLYTPHVRTALLESQVGAIWMVQRASFDQRLVEHAVDRGACLIDGTAVRRVRTTGNRDRVSVETDRGVIRARAVIGADGANSIVARCLGLRSDRERGYILALEAEGVRPRGGCPDVALIDFTISHGYAWLFPKGDVCNVGIGTGDRRQFRQLRHSLEEFVNRHHVTFNHPIRVVGHKIPTWRGVEPLHRGPVVLAGDAAGVADPFFGEGIAYAIQTGRFAADAVARFVGGDWPDLSGYTTAVHAVLGRDLRFWSILSKIVYRAPSVSVLLLSRNRLFQRLADQAISGDKSFSKAWKR